MAVPKRHVDDKVLRHLDVAKRAHLAPELVLGAARPRGGPQLRRHERALRGRRQAGHHLHVRGADRLVRDGAGPVVQG